VDWSTFLASLGGSGVVSGLVSLAVSKRESRDRQAVIALEREKWEHERDKPIRERQREALEAAIDALRNLMQYRSDNRFQHSLMASVDLCNEVARSVVRLVNVALADPAVEVQAVLGSFLDSYKPDKDPVHVDWLVEAEGVINYLDARAAQIV